MSSKIDKLKELNDLFKSGAINQSEFEALKSEILCETEEGSSEDGNVKSGEGTKEKIILKSFSDDKGKTVNPPSIEYVDFKNISKNEIDVLGDFLSKKIVFAPNELTEDENKILNKLFTANEIEEIISRRKGFNLMLSFVSIFCSGVALYITLISPFLMIFGGSILIVAGVTSVIVLNKTSATKWDKIFGYLSLLMCLVTLFLFSEGKSFFGSNSENVKEENSVKVDCSNKSDYHEGYASGELALTVGGKKECKDFVEDYNYRIGRDVLNATDCFCEGFKDRLNGLSEKYMENVAVEVAENVEVRVDSAQGGVKEERWNEFEGLFHKAVSAKSKEELLKITVPNSEFWGDYDFKSDYFLSNEDSFNWEQIQTSLSKGVKPREDVSEMKITIDNVLVFEFVNGKWYWLGFMGD